MPTGSLVITAAPVVTCVLVAILFVVMRRALRRASTLIGVILHEELDAAPAMSRSSKKYDLSAREPALEGAKATTPHDS